MIACVVYNLRTGLCLFCRHKVTRSVSVCVCVRAQVALILLLAATVHWWPFAFFLMPVAIAHGVQIGHRAICATGWLREESRRSRGMEELIQRGALAPYVALAASAVSSMIVLALVWTARQSYMELAGANRYMPFLFAGVSLISCFVASIATAAVVFLVIDRTIVGMRACVEGVRAPLMLPRVTEPDGTVGPEC